MTLPALSATGEEEPAMIDAYCPRHDATLLFTERRITDLRNTPRGIELEILCYCGERILIVTGRAAARPLPADATTS